MDPQDPYQPRDIGDEYERSPDPSTTPRAAGTPSYVRVPCTSCGYNLTGIAIGGNCPECGALVDNSLYAASSAPANGYAITSMVIGIVSLTGLCCCPTGFLGVIGLCFGIAANNQIKTGSYNNASKGMATAGLICSGVAIGLAIVWVLLAVLN